MIPLIESKDHYQKLKVCVRAKFNDMVRSGVNIYLSKDPDIKQELNKRKAEAKIQNKGLKPYIQMVDNYVEFNEVGKRESSIKCHTCGCINRHHPVTSYCFTCDTDNW